MARSASQGAPWWRDLLALVAATVLLVAVAYVGVGLVAAVAQDGYTAEMQAGLGRELSLPVRMYYALAAWLWRLAPLIALLPFALLGVRWVVRRSARVGESWTFDLLVAPVVGAALAGVLAAVFVATHPAPRDDAFAAAGWAAALTAFVLLLASFVAALLARSRVVRIGVIAVAALLLLVRAGADLWGSWRLGQYDRAWELEVAAERARAAADKRPVLRGEPQPGNAAPRYQAVFDSVRAQVETQGYKGRQPIERAARARPEQPVPEGVRATVDAYHGALTSLRDAMQSETCDWQLPFGELYWKNRTALTARFLGESLVVLGHERAQAQDPKGAASAYLDAVRLGADYGGGDLVMAMWGTMAETVGLEALGRWITAGEPGLVPLAEVDRELGLLEGRLASMSAAYRHDRLALGHFVRRVDESPRDAGLQEPKILPWIVPYRALAARALVAYDPYERDLEEALLAEDPAAAVATSRRIETAFGSSWNPIARAVSGRGSGPFDALDFHLLRRSQDHDVALLRLSRFAIRIEQSRTQAGLYPSDARELHPPVDPLAWPRLLRYEVRSGGRGYKVWSVGFDGKDDGGEPESQKDLVFERRPR